MRAKLSRQEKALLIAVPTGTPTIVAILKPAKVEATSIARFSIGAIILTNTRINEIIVPATAAVTIRETNSQNRLGATAVKVLPIKKIKYQRILN